MAGRPGSARPALSVVVPVYNVAGYLRACLDSIASQGVTDLEVIAVDDGSTDDSPAILAQAATADPRLHVITQSNAGLGAARNAGADAARGEFLWFVDSDDLLALGAIQRLLGLITATGSDLATGNVLRLRGADTSPARFLAPTFARTRLRTHIHRFPPLIADRVAWNKVFRRSFWDRHDFRFPEGVHYEDQYVTLPAHYLARAVDVAREPVYLWRVREDEDGASITQQREDPASMADRVRAVQFVSSFLADRGLASDQRRYDESAVTHDLRYFLERFDRAGPAFRDEFMRAVPPYLDGVDPQAFAHLPAICRLEWEAARARDVDGLAELIRFEREDLASVRATRVGRRWYAEVPGGPVQVRRELQLVSTIDGLAVDADVVRIRGRASVELLGPVRGRLRMVAVPESGAIPLVLRTTASGDGGYVAELSLTSAARVTRGRTSRWRLVLHSHDQGVRRIAVWHEPGGTATGAAYAVAGGTVGSYREVRLELVGRGRLQLVAGGRPPVVQAARIDANGVLDLVGDLGDLVTTTATLSASGPADAVVSSPAHIDRSAGTGSFVARLPLEALLASGRGRWSVGLRTSADVRRVVLAGRETTATVAGVAVTLDSDENGYLALTIG